MPDERTGRKPEQDVPGQELLRVSVGSHAHGTATADSDIDQRVVFAMPTSSFFQIGKNPKETVWVEHGGSDGKLDITGWELGKYVKLATQCNPTVLEVLWAPVVYSNAEGEALRGLRGSLLNKKRVYDAFNGYASNQRKKMLGEVDQNREGITWTPHHWKFAPPLIRVLHQGARLLESGELPVALAEGNESDKWTHRILINCREGRMSPGEVIDEAQVLRIALHRKYLESSLPTEPDLSKAQELLDGVRSGYYYSRKPQGRPQP